MTSPDPQGVRTAPTSVTMRAPLSSEPIVDFAMRWLVDLVFALVVLAIVYMSFVPFDLTLTPPDRGWRTGRIVLGLDTGTFNLPDILANIAYYVPISAIGFFVLRRRIGSIGATLAILCFGSALSFGVEFAQQWTLTRVSAWADFMANVIGLFVGLTLAIITHPFVRLFVRSARESAHADLHGAAAKLVVCLLLFAHVRPFDLVADVPRTILNTARHGNFRFTARWNDLASPAAAPRTSNTHRALIRTDRSRYEYAMEQLASIAGYAALASLLMASSRRMGRAQGLVAASMTIASIAWCGFVTVSLAAIVTVLRVLMVSHGLDTAHVLCGVMGWPLGVMGSLCLIDSPRRHDSAPGTAPWMSVAGLSVAAWVIVYELIPFDFASDTLSNARMTGRITLIPLSGHLAGSVPNLVADVTGKILRYAALAACISIPFATMVRTSWRAKCMLVTVATAAIVAALQIVHLVQASRSCDTTNMLLAGISAFVTMVMVRGVRDVWKSPTRMVDDLLTRQLIEGETYDKHALSVLRRSRNGASPTEAAQVLPRD